MWRSKQWWLAGLGVALLLPLVWAFWPAPTMVDVVEVVRGPLRVTIDEEGETRVRERFVISAPVAGRVLRIDLQAGECVTAGMVVATLQPAATAPLDARSHAEASARVAVARAAIDLARAARDQAAAVYASAERDLQRHRELDDARLVSRERLDAVQAEFTSKAAALRAAEAAARSAQEELKVAQAALVAGVEPGASHSAVTVRAPVGGVILRRLHESEAVVPAGEPLLEIGDVARLEIVSDLLSTDAVRVTAGQPVLVEGWGGNEPLRAVVRRVEPFGFTKVSALGVEEQRVNVISDLAGAEANVTRLGDGYRVEVRVVVWERPDAVKIPVSSLFRSGSEWHVFTVSAGKAVEKPVAIGEQNSLEAEVLDGVTVGERVILHPPASLLNNSSVAAR